MTTPTQAQEIDGSDEQDHDAMEVALGAAIAALLLANLLPGPFSFFTGRKAERASWDNQLEAALGPTLRGFLQRSAMDLASESKTPGADTAALQTAEQLYPKMLSWAQDNAHKTLQNLTDDKLDDETVAHRALTAAEGLARGLAVYAKSDVRERTAGKLGAVWKIWRTRHDDRVRFTHEGLDENRVPFDGHFVAETGSVLSYPGDPDAPISETAGCRCHLVYRLHDVETGGADFAPV